MKKQRISSTELAKYKKTFLQEDILIEKSLYPAYSLSLLKESLVFINQKKSEIKENFPSESFDTDHSLVTQLTPEWALPVKERLPWNMSRPLAPDLYVKRKITRSPTIL